VRPSVVRFMPPLTVTEAEIDEAVDIVESVLDELESR
jgi:4-aminobutyrate aminotransferase-like enzyme